MTNTPERKTALQDMSEFLSEKRDAFTPGTEEYTVYNAQVNAADLADVIVSTFGTTASDLSRAMIDLAMSSPDLTLLVIRAMAAALRFYELGLSDAQARLDALDDETRDALLKAAQ